MIVNTTKTEDNRNAYDFTARGTHYTVIECGARQPDCFEVFSERKNAAFGLQIKIMTRAEMANRSKALAHLAELIAAPGAIQ